MTSAYALVSMSTNVLLHDHQFGTFETFDDGFPIGHDATGLVQIIQHALMFRPPFWNTCRWCRPDGCGGLLVRPRCFRRTRGRRRTVRPADRQSRSHVTHFATTHRIGLAGEENGPLPSRHRAPVAMCRLSSALVFQVPCVDWFRPIVQQDIQFSAVPMSSAARRRSSASILQISATTSGGYWAANSGICSAVGELGDELGIGMPVLDDQVQQTVEQGEVGCRPSPGETGRPSRRWCCAADRRRSARHRPDAIHHAGNRIGWQSAILAPITKNTSA